MWFRPLKREKKKHAAEYLHAQLWSTVRVMGFLLCTYMYVSISGGKEEVFAQAMASVRGREKKRTVGVIAAVVRFEAAGQMTYMAWHGIMYLMYYPCGGGSWMLLLMSVVQMCAVQDVP